MPRALSRKLTGRERSARGNRFLGYALAFVAGATNAGAFLAVRQYTSHMTGLLSSMADAVALHQWHIAFAALGGVVSFMAGAALSAVLIVLSRRRELHSEYAAPLVLEALLLALFGLIGGRLATIDGLVVPATVMLLCLTMGLQNAIITKISRAEIRTTHMTGIVTDIGIELGKLLYRGHRVNGERAHHVGVRARLRVLTGLLSAFFLGGLLGALGFQSIGYLATVPLALLLMALAFAPVLDDLTPVWRRLRPGH